jgi:hypothetical protein
MKLLTSVENLGKLTIYRYVTLPHYISLLDDQVALRLRGELA